MTLEIRPYREEEAEAFNGVGPIVFGNYTLEPRSERPAIQIPSEWSMCAFEDGQLTTTYAAWPFTMRLNGAKATAAGVTMVGTLPWFRRRGHLRKIMETDLRRRYEQRMEPLAILLASIAGIYQRYGYAVVSTNVRYTIDPRWIAFAPSVPPSPGTWRQGTKDELPLLERMYREFSGPRNGYLHRAPVIWEGQVFGIGPAFGWDVGPSLIAVYEEGGEPKGYATYAAKHLESSKDGGPPGQRVWVRDFVWNTTGAYRGLWEMLRNFDLASRIIFFHQPKDDPAFDIMLNPRELNATHGDALLGRIVDVERLLPLRPYGHEGKVTFELLDEMCPWNAGRWALEAGAEGRTLTRTKETPQLTMDVSTLVQLLFGQLSPTHAVRFGRAEASPDAPLALWDAMWRTEYAPFCPDGF